MKQTILIDMDGVCVNLHEPWQERLRQKYNVDVDFSKVKESITDECEQLFSLTEKECVSPFYEEGFWLGLPPQDDVLDYFHKLEQLYDLVIVTKSHMESPYCSYEKYLWVKKHLGTQKVIMTKYKSYVKGNFLIDDMVANLEEYHKKWNTQGTKAFYDPAPKLVCYDQTWNQNVAVPVNRVKNWKEIYQYFQLQRSIQNINVFDKEQINNA